MTQGQISCFLSVADQRSYTRAANSLYISQPSISKSVAKLEQELGFRLLERRDGELLLTEAGALMHGFFKRAGAELQDTLERARELAGNTAAAIRIGCPETWSPSCFYGRLAAFFERRRPGTRLSVECCRLSELMQRVQTGKLDAALTHDFYQPARSGLASLRLTDTGCGILYAGSRYPAVRGLEDFKDAEFLMYDYEIEKRIGGFIRSVCGESGFAPSFRSESAFSSALFKMSCGDGVMLFTDWDSAVRNASYGYFRLSRRVPVSLVFPEDGGAGRVSALARELSGVFSEPGRGCGE